MTLPFQINNFFEYDFLSRALLAGLLLTITCGLLSPFVVLRRLSFSADGLAHSSLGGLAIGIVILNCGLTPTLGVYVITLVFTFVVAIAMAWFGNGRGVAADTAIGACYVAAFAFGALLLCVKRRFSAHLEHFFFGNILSVTPLDCYMLAGLTFLTVCFCFTHWRWLAQWTFDEDLTQAFGIPVNRLRYIVILLIAATVILSVKIVGLLLVAAMLILPGAIGTLRGRRMVSITAIALVTAIASMLLGMIISNVVDAPPGPSIVLIEFCVFTITFVLRNKWGCRYQRN